MKKLLPLLFLLSLATIVEAAPAKHATRCRRCAHPCSTVVVAAKPETTSYNALDALLDAFSFTAGFRWDRELECSVTEPVDGVGVHDPFFFGGELRVPLNSWADLGGNFDRDFVEAPHWNARVFVAAHPWRK